MALKKLAYILFIFLISLLHTLTLTTWLAKDSTIKESYEGASLKNDSDSVFVSKRSMSVIDLDLNQLNK